MKSKFNGHFLAILENDCYTVNPTVYKFCHNQPISIPWSEKNPHFLSKLVKNLFILQPSTVYSQKF